MGDFFRTCPELGEDEIKRHITGIDNLKEADRVNEEKQLFDTGYITMSIATSEHPEQGAFIIEDGNYISGRYVGDLKLLLYRFAQKLLDTK